MLSYFVQILGRILDQCFVGLDVIIEHSITDDIAQTNQEDKHEEGGDGGQNRYDRSSETSDDRHDVEDREEVEGVHPLCEVEVQLDGDLAGGKCGLERDKVLRIHTGGSVPDNLK